GHGDREPAGGGAYVSTAVVCGPVLPRSRPRQGQGGPAAAVRADRGRAAVGPGGAVRADPGRDGGVQPAGGGVRGGRERDRDDRAGGDRRGLLVRRLGLRVHRRRCGGAGRRPVLVKGRREPAGRGRGRRRGAGVAPRRRCVRSAAVVRRGQAGLITRPQVLLLPQMFWRRPSSWSTWPWSTKRFTSLP